MEEDAASHATMKCPVCYFVLFASKTCANGHVICGDCHRTLTMAVSPPVCPLCRTQDLWYPNLTLDQLVEAQYPKEYARRMLVSMEWPALKAYILREIDPDFCYEQTEPTDAMNVAMHIRAIKQVLKMAHVPEFMDTEPFTVPTNLSSMSFTFLPITGFCQFGPPNDALMNPRQHLKHLLEYACLLYNSVSFYIKKQYFLVTCRYRFDREDGNDDDNLLT